LHKYLALGYNKFDTMTTTKRARSEAARMLARWSVKARKEKWGEDEFKRRLQEWGRLGGRPRLSGKERKPTTKGTK